MQYPINGQYPTDLLTRRQTETFWLAVKGKSNVEIAEEMIVAVSTARSHIRAIYNRLGISLGSGSRYLIVVYGVLESLDRGIFDQIFPPDLY